MLDRTWLAFPPDNHTSCEVDSYRLEAQVIPNTNNPRARHPRLQDELSPLVRNTKRTKSRHPTN